MSIPNTTLNGAAPMQAAETLQASLEFRDYGGNLIRTMSLAGIKTLEQAVTVAWGYAAQISAQLTRPVYPASVVLNNGDFNAEPSPHFFRDGVSVLQSEGETADDYGPQRRALLAIAEDKRSREVLSVVNPKGLAKVDAALAHKAP